MHPLNSGNWIQKNISAPLSQVFRPLSKNLSNISKSLKEAVSDGIFSKVTKTAENKIHSVNCSEIFKENNNNLKSYPKELSLSKEVAKYEAAFYSLLNDFHPETDLQELKPIDAFSDELHAFWNSQSVDSKENTPQQAQELKQNQPYSDELHAFWNSTSVDLKENIPQEQKAFITPETSKTSPPQTSPKQVNYTKDQLLRFQNGLGIGLLPDQATPTEKQIFKEMNHFLLKQINDKASDGPSIHKMNELAVKCPLFNVAMKMVARNYEEWYHIADDPAKLEQLKNKMEKQHQNLVELAKVLDGVENKQNLPLLGYDKTMKAALQHFLNGKLIIGLHENKELANKINLITNSNVTETYRRQKPSAPIPLGQPHIDENVIAKEAELFVAERHGKNFVEQQPQLKAQGTSVNMVVKMSGPLIVNFDESLEALNKKEDFSWLLCRSNNGSLILAYKIYGKRYTEEFKYDKDGDLINEKGNITTINEIKDNMKKIGCTHINETIAFYKQGQGGEKASGIMEKMMWDLAVVMGAGNQFAATKKTAVRTQSEMSGGQETATTIGPDGELKKVENVQAAQEGGIQAAVPGVILSDLLDNPQKYSVKPTRESVLEGSLTTMVLGMWDAHSGNIMIDNEGKVKFFDNTRSMPHSNSFINRGNDQLVSSYRSGLLELPVCYENLTSAEIDKLLVDIRAYEAKINDMKDFFKNPATQAEINGLPPGWLNSKEAISATEERIANLKSVLIDTKNTGQPLSIRDLSLAFNPEYKLNAAMQIIKTVPQVCKSSNEAANMSLNTIRRIQQSAMPSIGYDTFDQLLDECLNYGIDPMYIKQLCEDPSLNFDQIVDNIGKQMVYNNNYDMSTEAVYAKILYLDIDSKAKIDFKDYDRDACIDLSGHLFMDNLEKNKIPYSNFFNSSHAYNYYFKSLHQGQSGVYFDNSIPPNCKLYHKHNQYNTGQFDIDFISIPNKIILKSGGIELPPMSMEEVNTYLNNYQRPTWTVDYVKAIEANCRNSGVKLQVLSNKQAADAASNLGPGEILIAQKHASDPPQFKMYRKTLEGKIEHFNLELVENKENQGKLAIKGTNSAPMSIFELKNLPPRKRWEAP